MCIDGDKEITHVIQCDLNLEEVKERLVAKGHVCGISQDAGEYICNYTYYRNLER